MAKDKKPVPGKVEETTAPPVAGEQIGPEGTEPAVVAPPGEHGEATLVDGGVSPMASSDAPPADEELSTALRLLDEASAKLEESTRIINEQAATIAEHEKTIKVMWLELDALRAAVPDAGPPPEPRYPRGSLVARCETGVMRKSTGQVMQLQAGDVLPKDADEEDVASGLRRGLFVAVEE